MKVLRRCLQCGGMNAPKLVAAGLLLVATGCVTSAGDLGAMGESSSAGESGGAASSEGGETSGGQPGGSSGVATSGSTSGAGEESSTGEPSDPPECGAGSGFQRRLTSTQFEHAVEDLFGVVVQVNLDAGFIPFEVGEEVSIEDSVEISMAAGTVAAQFDVPACAGSFDDCGDDFIGTWAPIVLRGGHAEALDTLNEVYATADTYEQGARAVVEAMINHPAFADLTPTGSQEDGVLVLDGNAVATRLALLVWNSVPDAALLATADTLTSAEGIESELGRLLDDPRFGRAQADLYRAMTGVDRLRSIDRSEIYPEWSGALAESMIEEQRRFVTNAVTANDASLGTLLGDSSTFVDASLAALYGDDLQTPAPIGNAWGPGELDPQRRGGLLTQLGFITATSGNWPVETYRPPTLRGFRVLDAFACRLVPPPPADLEIDPPDGGPIDTREAWDASLSAPECSACHDLTDPLGHAFGYYDSVGRWDPTEDSTSATHALLDVEFEDAVDLGAVLAESDAVLDCVAERYYMFAFRHVADDADACTVAEVQQAFADSGGNLRAAVQAIATSNAFRLAPVSG